MALNFPEPLYQQAYRELKRLIVTGKLQPGEKVIMSKLAEQYEISRTPLREALRQLQTEGLIVQTHSTMKIVELDKKDFLDLYETRTILEKEIVGMIVPLVPPEDFSELENLLSKSKEAMAEEDPYKILELNTSFHEKLMNYCPNLRMVQLLNHVRSLLLIYRANINKKAKNNLEIYKEHLEILKAIKARDVQQAKQLIEVHMQNDQKRGLEDL
ncbi:GntR family transcriptional regulator [Mesobacillus maritimus]|uniref:GntR family transcriptional regulator n=1 Tax=Mesobacillus maritimus TaxID=1643336 RepID=UPI00203AA026|nr:GntR family transcriptional regulator [Mesobacillus maritimus]MCM3585959.1 GntR family transcriptional regulator [Mesobacillus maritimus]MCM3670380.1 GntR family transcriptional regulator [Mesobacillus maritimus]